ncbi:unnamed protein product [Symbiodinium natans]|uniref:MIF4G domain-containing protein n=1 Tax=Symbiodinium natans TaxID=878477 RepID=A0A812UIH6_9DINO|nr:unnamed protein product [Symbiodinium natans]
MFPPWCRLRFALVGMLIESKKDSINWGSQISTCSSSVVVVRTGLVLVDGTPSNDNMYVACWIAALQDKPVSRQDKEQEKDVVLPRTSTCVSPVSSPPAEDLDSQEGQQDPEESELKRSQSLPASELKRSDTSSSMYRSQTKEKGRSDEPNWRSMSSRPVRTISAPVPKPKSVPKMPASPLSALGKDLTEMQKVERQVKSILNKLTWDKFDKLYEDLVAYCMVENPDIRSETVEVIARDVFKKATLQHNFIELYADLCARLDADLKQRGIEVNFRRALLQQCQESFTVHLAPPEIDSCLDYEEQYEMLVKYKTKMLGNVKLIAHLLRLRMLAAKIIFHCIEELISIGSAEAQSTREMLTMLTS